MESLNDIGLSEDTDKAALVARGSHHYADLYDLLFRQWRDTAISMLEIGVLEGGSIRTWRRYFPKAHITAIDVSDKVQFPNDSKIEFIHGDAYSDEVISKLPGSFDLIIDDGDHNPVNQKIFLQRYSPLLKPEGILIVEDVVNKEDTFMLKDSVPSGFSCAILEMTEGNSIFISRMLVVYRNL